MNGPQHYAEAERLLTLAADGPALVAAGVGSAAVNTILAAAQVHATLAAAAAAVEQTRRTDA